MHDRYTKLFSTIITSSIYASSDSTFRVWITFLALADSDGFVSGTIPMLARICGYEREVFEEALQPLLDPDPDSRSKEFDGRRVEAVDGGWKILNYQKFDEMIDLEKRREQTRERVMRYRERQKKCNANVTKCNANVTHCNDPQPQPQPYINNKNNSISMSSRYKAGASIKKDIYDSFFEEFWRIYPKREGSNPKKPAFTAFLNRLKDGVSKERLIEQAKNYAEYCRKKKILGTSYVKQAQFWLSPTQEGWEQDWTVEEEEDLQWKPTH